ncbi:TMV resistance protein N [Capsicum galapagoense]
MSPEIIQWSYDVFLSFRGEDIRKSFVDHLYVALQQKGINTFKDDKTLQKGNSISLDLTRAIEESRIALIIFSKNYAHSTWCLDEVVKIMECKNVKGQIVLPVFYDVDPSTVRKQKSSFGEAFSNHEDCCKVQKWRAALEEAANLSGWDLPNTANAHEAMVIKQIVEHIMARLGSHRHARNAENLVGMESRMQKVYKMLGIGSGGVRFLGILGMSGVGKTTLARVIYDNIRSQFEGACFLHEVKDRSAKQGLERLQEILLSEILVTNDLRINNLYEGASMEIERLQYKKVLLVLDDVDHIDQLEALAGKREWYGLGSRVIITTKDKHLLVKHEVEKIYRMTMLNDNESLQLFKLYALKKNHLSEEFRDLSAQVIRHSGGLPLALKVLGSFLYGRDFAEWKSEVERLEQIPEDGVVKKLELSFNGLNNIEQKILLDIVCFFIGKKKESVTRILESFNFSPVIGIKVLMEKSLIMVSQGRILVHQLIQEMCWYIIRQEASADPRRYSRLWLPWDISDVLAGDLGTEKIEGMSLNSDSVQAVNVSSAAFQQMSRLRFLSIQNMNVPQGPSFLPGELRWFNWHAYPSRSLPVSFRGEKLVGLKLKDSRITQLWQGSKVLGKLKYINLSRSEKLIRTPDLSGTPNLERLVLEECTSLVEVNFSVGDLRRLVLLNLKSCTKLKTLPKNIQLENLEVFILSGCSKLKTFPEIKEKMNCLSEIYLEGTALRELPSSIENLSGVSLINLSYCKHLKNLPSSIFRLKCLRTLALFGCSKLEKLSDDVGLLECLEELYCDGTAIRTIPSSISLLKSLKHLSFHGCNALGLQLDSSIFSSWLPGKGQNSMGLNISNLSSLCSLTTLDISHCNISDGGTLCNLGCLSSLVELNLSGNSFTNIPDASISGLTQLIRLELVGCRKLVSFPELPQCIEEVHADECTPFESIDQLVKYPMLRCVYGRCFHHGADYDKINALWNNITKAHEIRVDSMFATLSQRDPGGLHIQTWGRIFR